MELKQPGNSVMDFYPVDHDSIVGNQEEVKQMKEMIGELLNQSLLVPLIPSSKENVFLFGKSRRRVFLVFRDDMVYVRTGGGYHTLLDFLMKERMETLFLLDLDTMSRNRLEKYLIQLQVVAFNSFMGRIWNEYALTNRIKHFEIKQGDAAREREAWTFLKQTMDVLCSPKPLGSTALLPMLDDDELDDIDPMHLEAKIIAERLLKLRMWWEERERALQKQIDSASNNSFSQQRKSPRKPNTPVSSRKKKTVSLFHSLMSATDSDVNNSMNASMNQSAMNDSDSFHNFQTPMSPIATAKSVSVVDQTQESDELKRLREHVDELEAREARHKIKWIEKVAVLEKKLINQAEEAEKNEKKLKDQMEGLHDLIQLKRQDCEDLTVKVKEMDTLKEKLQDYEMLQERVNQLETEAKSRCSPSPPPSNGNTESSAIIEELKNALHTAQEESKRTTQNLNKQVNKNTMKKGNKVKGKTYQTTQNKNVANGPNYYEQLVESEKRNSELQMKMSTLITQLSEKGDEEVFNLRLHCDNLQTELLRAVDQCQTLQTELQSAVSQCEEYEEELREKVIDRRQSFGSSAEASFEQHETIPEEEYDQNKQNKHEDSMDNNNQVESAYSSTTADKRNIAKLTFENKQLERKLKNAISEMKHEREQFQILQAEYSNLELQGMDDNNQVESTFSSTAATTGTTEKRNIAKLTFENKHLERKLEKAMSEMKQEQEQFQLLQAEYARLELQCLELGVDLQASTEEVSNSSHKNTVITDLKKELEELKTVYQKTKDDLEHAKSLNENQEFTTDTINELSAEYSDLKTRYEALEVSCQVFQAEAEEEKMKAETAEAEKDVLEQQNAELHVEIGAYISNTQQEEQKRAESHVNHNNIMEKKHKMLIQQLSEIRVIHIQLKDEMNALVAEHQNVLQYLTGREITLQQTEAQCKLEHDLRKQYYNYMLGQNGGVRIMSRTRPLLPLDLDHLQTLLEHNRLPSEFMDVMQALQDQDINKFKGMAPLVFADALPQDVFDYLSAVLPCHDNDLPPGEMGISIRSLSGITHRYHFERCFAGGATQDEVFEQAREFVENTMDGFDVAILAYGQTCTGKTHTMFGNENYPGVATHSIDEIFNIKKDRVKDGKDYDVYITMKEIYLDRVYDLLAPDALDKKQQAWDISSPHRRRARGDDPKNLSIRHSENNELEVKNETRVQVRTVQEAHAIFNVGLERRHIGKTDMNAVSSRSHCVFTFYIHRKPLFQDRERRCSEFVAKFQLVDLAGSERLEKSNSSGPRLEECQFINRSLSALGKMMRARCKGDKHVPYRDSKLTYLLEDAFKGDSKILMLVHTSPSLLDVSESNNTLTFATGARNLPSSFRGGKSLVVDKPKPKTKQSTLHQFKADKFLALLEENNSIDALDIVQPEEEDDDMKFHHVPLSPVPEEPRTIRVAETRTPIGPSHIPKATPKRRHSKLNSTSPRLTRAQELRQQAITARTNEVAQRNAAVKKETGTKFQL